jgi:hypothetical protein
MKKLRGYTPKNSESASIVEQIPDDKMLEFCLGLKDLIPDHRTSSIRCHQRRPSLIGRQKLLEMGISEEELLEIEKVKL